MSEHYNEKPFVYSDTPQSTDDEFFGHGWSVRQENGKYILSYISGELAGHGKQIEISADDFHAARAGTIDLDGLCIKYGVN